MFLEKTLNRHTSVISCIYKKLMKYTNYHKFKKRCLKHISDCSMCMSSPGHRHQTAFGSPTSPVIIKQVTKYSGAAWPNWSRNAEYSMVVWDCPFNKEKVPLQYNWSSSWEESEPYMVQVPLHTLEKPVLWCRPSY